MIKAQQILQAVCKSFGCSAEDLKIPRQVQEISDAKHTAVYLSTLPGTEYMCHKKMMKLLNIKRGSVYYSVKKIKEAEKYYNQLWQKSQEISTSLFRNQ